MDYGTLPGSEGVLPSPVIRFMDVNDLSEPLWETPHVPYQPLPSIGSVTIKHNVEDVGNTRYSKVAYYSVVALDIIYNEDGFLAEIYVGLRQRPGGFFANFTPQPRSEQEGYQFK